MKLPITRTLSTALPVTRTLSIAMILPLSGLVLCLLLLSNALAQAQGAQFEPPEIKFTSSLTPVGSGARALGMGGAFIAFADDATAASWNPAGLKHLLRPEMSIVGYYDDRREGFSFSDSPGASNHYQVSGEYLNYLSMTYPFRWINRNFIFSLNYQNLYSLRRRMHFLYHYENLNEPLPISMDYEVTYRQKGNLKAISPAIATFVAGKLSFGLTLNFWSDKLFDNGWVEDYSRSGRGTVGNVTDRNETAGNGTVGTGMDETVTVGTGMDGNGTVETEGFAYESYREKKDRYSFSGFNVNYGFLWDISPVFTIGAVVKTPFTARIRHEGKSLSHQVWPDDPALGGISYDPPQHDEQKLGMPLSYGIGLAVRPLDQLIFDLDITRTEWNGYVLHDRTGQRIDPITGLPKEQSPIEPTHQVRLGGEYVFLHKGMTLSPRLGLFYDPEPASKKPDDFYGFSLGLGVTLGRIAPVAIDMAYQYRFGTNVEGDSIMGENSPADVRQHLFYHSVIYYF
ncbi:MAG: hypothetical protein AB1847_15185 [bacterium]